MTTSKAKYDNCKRNTFESVSKLRTFGWFWLGLAILVFILLIVVISTNIDPIIIAMALRVMLRPVTSFESVSPVLRAILVIMTAGYFLICALIFIE